MDITCTLYKGKEEHLILEGGGGAEGKTPTTRNWEYNIEMDFRKLKRNVIWLD
jgi:hypothetical protein